MGLAIALALVCPHLLSAQQPSAGRVGIFQGSTDIGNTKPGSTVFDPANATYRVIGGGADMWGTADAFHFTWVRLNSDATLSADVHFPDGTLVPLEKAVLIFRQTLDPDSAYADIAIHGDGHITLQFRAVSGGKTEDTLLPEKGATRLRIQRKGNLFTASAGQEAGSPASVSTTVAMKGPVYVGIGVCAHDAQGTATVTFSNVSIH